MANDFTIIKSAGCIKDLFWATPALFEGASLLIVALDSLRELSKVVPMFTARGLDVRVLEEKLWLPPEVAAKIFETEGILTHFDSMYIFPYVGDTPTTVPQFDLTTDFEGVFSDYYLMSICAELRKTGANAYVADGCDILAVVRDATIAEQILTQLPSAMALKKGR